MTKTCKKKVIKVGAERGVLKREPEEAGTGDSTKPGASGEWDAELTKIAQSAVRTETGARTAKPKFNPTAWRHRPLGEPEPRGGAAGTKNVTARERPKRAQRGRRERDENQ